MPKPPRIDALDQMRFITQYFWQGCDAPFSVVVEFSQQPAGDVFLLLFSLDLDDILKSWLRPGNPRHANERRHGRKRPKGGNIFDVNEMLGGRARAEFGPYPGIDLPGSRALFRITDHIDRVNWTAAIIEAGPEWAFGTLWGIISSHPEVCPGLGWVDAGYFAPQPILGSVPLTSPFAFDHIYSKQFFEGPTPFVFTSFRKDFQVAATATITALTDVGCIAVQLLVRDDTDTTRGESQHVTLARGESATVTVSGKVSAGNFAYISRQNEFGSIDVSRLRVFAFEEEWF